MAKEKYKRATDLFVTGKVLVPDPDGPPYWLQKLNTVERDEAQADAAAVRARAVLLMKRGSDEVEALREAVKAFDTERLISGIVASNYTKILADASGAVQADPDWVEKLDAATRVGDISLLSEAERQIISDINTDFMEAVNSRVEAGEKEMKQELEDLDVEEVQRRYIDCFVDNRAANIFAKEYRLSEIYFGVRECEGVQEDGDWNHDACNHDTKVYESVDEVRALPDALTDIFSRTFDSLNVPARTAKDSARRQASSEPSRPPSAQGDSAPSTPEVTSPEPVGTSV